MAKMKINKATTARARAASQVAAQPQSKLSVVGILIGLLGWIAAGVAGYAMYALYQQAENERARFAHRIAELKEEQRELQKSAADLAARQLTAVNDLNNQISEESRKLNALSQRVDIATRRVKNLRQEATQVRAVDTSASTELQDARAELAAAKEELERLTKERREKLERKENLIAEYKRRRAELIQSIRDAMDRDSVLGVRAVYNRYKHTPYAAAAAFFTGEKAVEVREYKEARRYFERVIREYPRSPYVEHAQARLEELAKPLSDREFDDLNLDIMPTK